MKKLFFLLIATGGALSAMAQAPDLTAKVDTPKPKKAFTRDSGLMHWVFDANFLGGWMTQDLEAKNTITNYTDYISGSSVGKMEFKEGMSYGFNAQIGYFFGRSNHWGIGAGFMYLWQKGDLTLDNYHVEYRSTDYQNNTFRQVITANHIKEELEIHNMNIPVVLKYKTRFSKVVGFTADAGVLINLQTRSNYKTNASFDYEAIYQYHVAPDGGVSTSYDNSVPPNANDQLLTRAQYAAANPGLNVQSYFNDLHNKGYNVGLGVTPQSKKGDVTYDAPGWGFIVQPSFNFYLSDMVALNLGGYYMYQTFKQDVKAGYRMTDKVGEYSSMLNTISSGSSQSYGVAAGIRVYFGKAKDSDHDGIPDKKDKCPTEFGLVQFQGCPDRDGDGIPDYEDSCATVAGLLQFHGCPDSDNDGIPDKDDACPYQPGIARFQGCPDTDGDGIPDKEDLCPTKPGPSKFQGCPDTDGDGVPDNLDKCPDTPGPESNNGCPLPPPPPPQEVPMTTPIRFEVNKTVIQKTSYPVLESAKKKLEEDKTSIVIVDGYTDITGKAAYNKKLSLKRANAVKKELVKMGINPKRIKIVGHGAKSPVGDNKTSEGRMLNRRAVMHLNITE